METLCRKFVYILDVKKQSVVLYFSVKKTLSITKSTISKSNEAVIIVSVIKKTLSQSKSEFVNCCVCFSR